MLQLPLVLLLLLPATVLVHSASTSPAANRLIRVNHQADTTVFHRNLVRVAGYQGVTVTSQFPVSSLRFSDHYYYVDGQSPIYDQDLYVVVKSDCSEEELGGVKPVVEYDFHPSYIEGQKPTRVKSISVFMPDTTTVDDMADINDVSFMEPSSFLASWDYSSYWCQYYNIMDEQTTHNYVMGKQTAKGGSTGSTHDDADYSTDARSTYYAESAPVTSRSGTTTTNEPTVIPQASGSGRRQQHVASSLLAWTAFLVGGLTFTGSGSGGRTSYLFLASSAVVMIVAVVVHGLQNETTTNTTVYNETTATTMTETRPAPPRSSRPICKVNVELMHDGCRLDQLHVQAPSIRLVDVRLENQSNEQDDDDECLMHLQANLTFPVPENEQIVTQNNTALEVYDLPQLEGENCYVTMEGRPFVNDQGQQLQAGILSSKEKGFHNEGWCATATGMNARANNMTVNSRKESQAMIREAMGQDWAQRALGEHASVSSFAAFTMALMANNAPPQLIQDSISAAADEVRHAKVSFEIASMLLGQVVEPGPLPPSSHTFDHNLTALALSTAREGCIEETLAAIKAALEVEDSSTHHRQEFISKEEQHFVMDSLKTIALEEASHSALAWRTIQWVCGRDKEACDTVMAIVFDPKEVQKALERRFQGRGDMVKAKAAWKKVFETLAPVATGKSPFMALAPGADDGKESFAWIVARQIIQRVKGQGGFNKAS